MAPQTIDMANDPSVKFGEFLAHPLPGEEVVVSGISGLFPLSSNIDEFKFNLYNKENMLTSVQQRNPELPPALGMLKSGDRSKFDAGFFGIHNREVRTMSQTCKLLLEKCVECIFDAGLHPEDLEGTRTGVYSALNFNENELHWYFDEPVEKGNAVRSNMNGMTASRISYFLKLKGPAINADTACSSSFNALNNAYVAIRKGTVDQAIVCAGSLILSTGVTLQFARLGVVSKEGVLRAFDENASGYVRAETVSAVLLQKAKDSNRIYAKIIHTKTNTDGYKEEGITYPSGKDQLKLLKEIYFESGVNPKDMSYIEAHGTGTRVGDPEELNGIDEFYAQGRSKPLLIGSVKSNMGHPEPSSGFCSLVKSILVFENNMIPPNMNFKSPRRTVPGLLEGRMQIVVEPTPYQDKNGLIGVSNFGFGGGNAHAILKWNTKTKLNNGKPLDNLPRIVCVSGRTKEAVDCLLNDIAKKFDVEHIALIHNCFRKAVKNHLFRGYVIVSKQGVMKQSVNEFNPNISNLHISFGGLSRISGNLAQELLRLPVLANFKNSLVHFLTEKNLNLDSLLSNEASSNLNLILSNMITQLSLSKLLKLLQVEYTCVSGHSFGEFTAAYFENSLRLEEVLECVYIVADVAKDFERTKNGGGIPIVDLMKYKNKIETGFKRVLTISKQFNGYNGTEAKTTSPEYFVEAILETNQHEPHKQIKNSIVLEIGQSQGLISSKEAPTLIFNTERGIQGVLETLGSLYEYGMHPQVQKLYPEVQFPVSRGTPMISSQIKWKHDYDYFVPTFEIRNSTIKNVMKLTINLDDEWAPLSGHVVDGRNLFPATGYIYLAWLAFSGIQNLEVDLKKVVFENCKFKRACTLPKAGTSQNLELIVMIQRSSGKFEITEGDFTVVTGRIRYDESLPEFSVDTSVEAMIPQVDLLKSRDIYKELRLRGYNYTGLFRSLVQCDKKGTYGKVSWADHWIAFMDNMLQLNILAENTRLLFVPTRIARLSINPKAHLDLVEKLRSGDENKVVDIPIEYNLDTGTIRSGGIEIRGLLASSIPRKKITALPVLEKYIFVPNESRLPLEQSVRVFVQVALENNCGSKVKVAEVLNKLESDDELLVPLAPIIQDVLGDQPLVKGDITIFTSENLDVPVNVETKKFKGESEYTIVVGRNLLTTKEGLTDIVEATVDDGFIISREPMNFSDNVAAPSDLVILNISETNEEKLVFLRKQGKSKSARRSVYVNVSTINRTYSWLKELKEATSKDCDVIAWCQGEPLNGIIGLVNCLRREPGCQDVRSVFIRDQAPDFDPSIPFYKNQLDKNMGVNIFMNGQWGTYRHLLLDTMEEAEYEHCFVDSTVKGDLSSLRWIEGPFNRNIPLELNETLVDVYYSSINFKDVMIASGRLSEDVITRDRRGVAQGFEFSGKTKNGRRVMGMITQGALATFIKADNYLTWDVPDHWTLKDAATVPVVYATCLYALDVVGKIKPTDSVLIHSGTGGIGQSAINLCLHMGCTVFTTVGTEEKKQFIRKNFPQIKASHIGSSRDLSFEQMIYRETGGRGVDIVLNSLTEEKLFASVRCLAVNGRFLEIGKFDLANDNQLDLLTFKEGASYHGIMVDKFFDGNTAGKQLLQRIIQKNIDSGAIKPLMANVFDKHEVVQAFRFMTAGKHMGKVMIEVRKENESDVVDLKLKGLPRYFCDPDKCYIICGGLGGFGLELADWLVLRGAKNIILSSRKGISSGYQSYRISQWKDFDCNIKISTQDITTHSGCEELIKEANSIAPVHAIFNLAVILEDAILENQTEKSFETSFGPKAYATEYLDIISRKLCPDLRDFVVFSSVVCGRGNAGQTNYGMSNSVMERICEKRRKEGYPAIAIEWGAVGDVGLVAVLQEDHIELAIGGTLQQRIANCLQVMDVLLRQNEATIVSSIVVAEKKATSSEKIEEVIADILGIRDIKLVSLHSTLAELGMDSMSTVEVKQTLEREYNIFMSPSEVRSVTLARIKELGEQQVDGEIPIVIETLEKGFDPTEIYRNYYLSNSVEGVINLKTKKTDGKIVPRIIALPGVEGCCDLLENLTSNMEVEAYGINYQASKQTNSYPEMAERLLPDILDLVKSQNTFNIISHSMGCYLALELVGRLEKLGYLGTLTLVDGSPSYIKGLTEISVGKSNCTNLDVENGILAGALRMKINEAELLKASKEICMCQTLQEKMDVWLSYWKFEEIKSKEIFLQSFTALINRNKGALNYKPTFDKLKSKVKLYKPSIVSIANAPGDYDLGQYCEEPVDVKVIQGHHRSILENEELAISIMEDLLDVNGFAEA